MDVSNQPTRGHIWAILKGGKLRRKVLIINHKLKELSIKINPKGGRALRRKVLIINHKLKKLSIKINQKGVGGSKIFHLCLLSLFA